MKLQIIYLYLIRMDIEEDDGFHSLDEEDKIFDEIKQEILDEESMYLIKHLY